MAPGPCNLPLKNIRVLDLSLVWAGPHASQLLADWGAEVIRIEPLHRLQPITRGMRARPPADKVRENKNWENAYPDWDPGMRPWNRYPGFNVHARNKIGATANLTQNEGRRLLDKLVAISDVLIENNVPETGEKLGLDYERLKRINPTLIMVRMPACGLDSPYRNFRSLGSQVDGITGHTWVRSYPDLGLEYREDVFFSDAAGGVNAALATMMALRHRRKTGGGQLVELAQVENFGAYLGDVVMDYLLNGRIQSSLDNRHQYMAPHGCYPCKGENNWIAIGISDERQWKGLCKAMSKPEWRRGCRFSTELARMRKQDELDEEISQWTREQDKKELMHLLRRHGVPASALLTQSEVFQDPHYQARGFFQEINHPEAGTHLYPGILAQFARTPNAIRKPPVRLGEDNELVYKELLGVGDEEYQRLEAAGEVGMDYPAHVK